MEETVHVTEVAEWTEQYGYVMDADWMYLREISRDGSMAVWTINSQDAMIVALDYFFTNILGHYGAAKFTLTHA